jgi:adenine/guanine/hypoxanthine permease
MKLIPRSVKISTIVGMGMQIALVGMTSVKLVVRNEQTIVGLGDLNNYQIWLSFSGLMLIGSLLFHQRDGGILLGIAVITILTWIIEGSFPKSMIEVPNIFINPMDYIDFTSYRWNKCFTGIAAFTFIGLIDVSGVIFGMAKAAGLVGEDSSVPGAKATFTAVAVASMVAAATGGTPIIVYVESATGIKEGGKTGVTAIIIGLLFIITLPLAPLLGNIPVTATSPVAILIGALMMSQASEIDWHNMTEAIPAFLTLSVMPFTFSITDGILFGLLASMSLYVTTGQIFIDIRQAWTARDASSSTTQDTELIYFAQSNNANQQQQQQHHHHHRSDAEPWELQRKDSNSFLDNQPFVRTPSFILKFSKK